MNIFERIFKRKKLNQINEAFEMYTAYSPSFSTINGGLYEMDLTRAAIHALANHTSKLNPIIKGSAYKRLNTIIKTSPNQNQTTTQFLYRLRTIYEVENNAFIIPFYDDYGMIQEIYPVSTYGSSIVNVNGMLYLNYYLNNIKYTIEYYRVGHVKKMQYRDEFFGDSNLPINPTMQLLQTQNEGIENGIKNSAIIRFMAKLTNILRDEDVEKEKAKFVANNLSSTNNGGVMMFDNKYSDVKQIESKPFIIDSDQRKIIQDNVANYFGVSINVMQNTADENTWNAFYEGAIEPFGTQVSQVLTKMFFSNKELAYDNRIILEANRLQFASTSSKLNVATQLIDRGIMTINQALEIFNMDKVEDGDRRVIRGEYIDTTTLIKNETEEK